MATGVDAGVSTLAGLYALINGSTNHIGGGTSTTTDGPSTNTTTIGGSTNTTNIGGTNSASVTNVGGSTSDGVSTSGPTQTRTRIGGSSSSSSITHGASTTTTTKQNLYDQKAIDAMLQSAMDGTSGSPGLAAIGGMQRSAGGYGSVVNNMLANDLASRTMAHIAELQKKEVTTSVNSGSTDSTSSSTSGSENVTESSGNTTTSHNVNSGSQNTSYGSTSGSTNVSTNSGSTNTSNNSGHTSTTVTGDRTNTTDPISGAGLTKLIGTLGAGQLITNAINSPTVSNLVNKLPDILGGGGFNVPPPAIVTDPKDPGFIGPVDNSADDSANQPVVTLPEEPVPDIIEPEPIDLGDPGFADGGYVSHDMVRSYADGGRVKKTTSGVDKIQNSVSNSMLKYSGSAGTGVNVSGIAQGVKAIGNLTGNSNLTNLGNAGNLVSAVGSGNLGAGLSAAGSLLGNKDIKNLGTIANIATSKDPLAAAGNTLANVATHGVFNKVKGLYDTISGGLTVASGVDALANLNPIAGVINLVSNAFGGPSIGTAVSNAVASTNPDSFVTAGNIFSNNANSAGMADQANKIADKTGQDPLDVLTNIIDSGAGRTDTQSVINGDTTKPAENNSGNGGDSVNNIPTTPISDSGTDSGQSDDSGNDAGNDSGNDNVSGGGGQADPSNPGFDYLGNAMDLSDPGFNDDGFANVGGNNTGSGDLGEDADYGDHSGDSDTTGGGGGGDFGDIDTPISDDEDSPGGPSYNASMLTGRDNTYNSGGTVGDRVVELADGGKVDSSDGPTDGSGVDDRIPAQLSAGEFILSADTVKAIGIDKLEALQKKYHVPAAVQKLRNFARS